jgi:Tol biopolymer transport system component
MRKLLLLICVLFIYSLNYSQVINETDSITEGSEPVFSHDGQYIAFCHNRNIWILNLKTKEQKRISTLALDLRPQWSPDDKSIVFQSYGEVIKSINFEIWIVNIDGSSQHRFNGKINGNETDQTPFWSPDGKKIAWTHGKQLWISDIDGKNARQLTNDPANEYEYIVDWSRDSKIILYVRSDRYSGDYKVYMVDTYSQNQKRIELLKNVSCAKFDQDNISLYFTSYDNYISKYNFTTQTITKNIIKIKNDVETIKFNFSPDFKLLIFDGSGSKTKSIIFTMKI